VPFAPVTLSPGEEKLRTQVREFLARELPRGSYRPGLGMNADHSPGFSRRLAQQGGQVSGQLGRVPWGSRARAIAALADSADGPVVVALAELAATVAAAQVAALDLGAAFEVAAAQATAARAAAQVGPHAHQVHGAIGMTKEYELHHFTRRLLTWADEWGGAERWGTQLGERVLRGGAAGLWPLVATGIVAGAGGASA
jgi:hypothetical protein